MTLYSMVVHLVGQKKREIVWVMTRKRNVRELMKRSTDPSAAEIPAAAYMEKVPLVSYILFRSPPTVEAKANG